ncbi:MAG TPA: hypothetical protein VK007_05570 [Acidimicrobiales bacterium]|nr:hypothetical protein [Acidimicrobiales bacterium]
MGEAQLGAAVALVDLELDLGADPLPLVLQELEAGVEGGPHHLAFVPGLAPFEFSPDSSSSGLTTT